MDRLDAIILAGGAGTRLREAVPDLPKPLARIKDRPFLDLVLGSLDGCPRVRRVVIAAGYMADKLIAEYRGRTGFRFEIVFSVEESPLGTGGAIRKALPLTESGDVLALNGDSFVEVDLEALSAAHGRLDAAMTLVVAEVEDAGRYGRVELDAGGRVVGFEEKTGLASPGRINAGIYLFRRNLLDDVPDGAVLSWEREFLPASLGKGIYGFIARGKFIDIGLPEDYRLAQKYLEENLK